MCVDLSDSKFYEYNLDSHIQGLTCRINSFDREGTSVAESEGCATSVEVALYQNINKRYVAQLSQTTDINCHCETATSVESLPFRRSVGVEVRIL